MLACCWQEEDDMKVHIRRDPSGHVRAWIDLSRADTERLRGPECQERVWTRHQVLIRAWRAMNNHRTWPITVREHSSFGRWAVANIYRENTQVTLPYRGAA